MQGKVIVVCNGCQKRLGEVAFDTALDTSPGLFVKVEEMLRSHREQCRYYGTNVKNSLWVGI